MKSIIFSTLCLSLFMFACGNNRPKFNNSNSTVQSNSIKTTTLDQDINVNNTDQDGNTIKTITIGKQVWTVENLNVKTFANGERIPEAKTVADWQKADEEGRPIWTYFEFDSENNKKWGKLYNWHAVHDSRGLAPKGYHIPTNAEWIILIDYFGGQNPSWQLKSESGWGTINGRDGSGTNSSGFTCLPAGYFGNDITNTWNFSGGLSGAYFWSSTEYNTNEAWNCYLFIGDTQVLRLAYEKGDGLSCRCVKN